MATVTSACVAQKDDLAVVARAWLRQLLKGMHTLCFCMHSRISTPVSLSVAVCLPVQRRILTGSFVLSESQRAEYYDAARRMRQLIAVEFKKCFDAGVSVLVFAFLNVFLRPRTVVHMPRVHQSTT